MRTRITFESVSVGCVRQHGAWGMSVTEIVTCKHEPTGLSATFEDRSAHRARQRAFEKLCELIAAEPVPKLTRVWYPKSRRHYWNVSPFVKTNNIAVRDARFDRWNAAHVYAAKLNIEIGANIHAKRNASIAK